MNDILVVEDEPALAAALQQACKRKGLEARHAATVAQAREQILANPPRLLILDITLPDGSGLSLIDFCRDQGKNIPAIVITAHGSLENALDARRRGAVRYLVKPIDLEEFQAALMEQIESSPVERVPPPTSSILVGASPAMQKVFLEIAHASQSDAPVLLAGPHGLRQDLRSTGYSSAQRPVWTTVRGAPLPGTAGESYRSRIVRA
jgi:DNA-binding NtrC family response regulator